VGIESVVQKGDQDSRAAVPIIVLTHRANEADLVRALHHVDRLQDVTAPTIVMRIEEGA
jgi:CheY-like chemotaxis protein